jgi:hypothetical protein
LKSDPSPNENPFHYHSTLLGTLSSLVVVTALGWLTRWRSELIAVYIIGALVSFVLFARIFYGVFAARRLDKQSLSPGSGWLRTDDWHQETSRRLFQAYGKAQLGDLSELKALAEEEEST